MLRKFINHFWPTFKPLEEKILNLIGEKLPEDIQRLYNGQLEEVNKVYRVVWRESNLYYMKGGAYCFDSPHNIKCSLEEMKFATVTFSLEDISLRVIAELWLVKGRIFSITYNQNMSKHATKVDFSDIEVEIYYKGEDP